MQTGIDLCFPDVYKIHIDFENRRGKTECDIYLTNVNGSRIDPLFSNGGGLVDIISFALRVSCWAVSNTDNLIVLDEPGKFISKNLRPLFGELLKTLSEKLELQILMISHDDEFINCADKVFTVKKKNGISTIIEKDTRIHNPYFNEKGEESVSLF